MENGKALERMRRELEMGEIAGNGDFCTVVLVKFVTVIVCTC